MADSLKKLKATQQKVKAKTSKTEAKNKMELKPTKK